METLIIGIACAFIGALAGHRLGLHEARCDKRRDKINAVADLYHKLRQSGRSSGASGLMQCGVLGLRDADEIERAIKRIGELGHSDPLQPNRKGLQGKDVCHFFQIAKLNHLNLLQASDLTRAYELTKNA